MLETRSYTWKAKCPNRTVSSSKRSRGSAAMRGRSRGAADRADDLVQDTLLRALSKAHLWQAGTDIRAWLFTIMHNQHVNAVRWAIREQRTVDIDGMSSSLVAATDPTASRQLREFECALARLPDEQREVILLV